MLALVSLDKFVSWSGKSAILVRGADESYRRIAERFNP